MTLPVRRRRRTRGCTAIAAPRRRSTSRCTTFSGARAAGPRASRREAAQPDPSSCRHRIRRRRGRPSQRSWNAGYRAFKIKVGLGSPEADATRTRAICQALKRTATRSEAFLSDYQGRDLVTKVELALDAAGRFLAMRATNISNVGAHCVSLSPLSKGAGLIPGSYVVPAATLRAVAVFTNTMPTQAYRSSGRPEVTYAIERLVDIVAAELGMDRVALRRKNLVRPEAMPYRNAVGMLYDSGRYEENMDWALAVADWKGFPARRREAARRGKLLGLGLANYVESSIGAPREQARIEVQPEGRVT
jgi:CO/xanthine dehydrogenase Mo-binding subunit